MAIITLNNNSLSSVTSLPAAISTGKVLQVVNATSSTETSTSSTSYSDTNLSATITPSSSSNKILITVNHTGLLKQSSNNAGKIQLLRGSTSLIMFSNDFGRDGGTGLNGVGGTGTSYLDSPSTTSATTYKTQLACSVTAAAAVKIAQNNAVQTMTLMEIEA
jgi:hypothetical protein